MSTRDERLRQFFGGYFNQDWDIEGATSWHDVIVEFVRHVPKTHALLLIEDLRSWVAEATAKGTSNLPAAFNCEYDPRPDFGTERQWAGEVAEAMERQLSN